MDDHTVRRHRIGRAVQGASIIVIGPFPAAIELVMYTQSRTGAVKMHGVCLLDEIAEIDFIVEIILGNMTFPTFIGENKIGYFSCITFTLPFRLY